jgi:diguanylate cyclase (GGDEF)-like protein
VASEHDAPDETGADRDRTAEVRDDTSEARDDTSEARDSRAEARDKRAEAREARGDTAGAPADRAEALRDRRGGASDRSRSADDREAASKDRELSAEDRAIAAIDALTGTYRREVGMLLLDHDVLRAKRTNQPFTLAFVDLDDLKAVNDSLGHVAGDQLLRATADAIRGHLRPYDLIVRYGVDLTMAAAAERFVLVNADLAATRQASVSAGLAQFETDDALEDLIARADEALYSERERPTPPDA